MVSTVTEGGEGDSVYTSVTLTPWSSSRYCNEKETASASPGEGSGVRTVALTFVVTTQIGRSET